MTVRHALLVALQLAVASGLHTFACCNSLTAAARAPPIVLAGFGASKSKGKKKTKAKPAGVTAKQSWDLFRTLRDSDQVQTTTVFAKLPEDDAKWLNVGGVITEAPGIRQQGVNLNKRLILEHAARLHPSLAARSRELVCGFIETGEAPGEVVPLEKCQMPSEFRAGFQGLPHKPTGMYMLTSGVKARQ